jgi:hypothetical protein
MPLSEAIKECLACESHFKQSDSILKGVTITLSEQYCSKECEENFEQFLAAEVAQAEQRALNSPEQKLSEADVRKIVNNFHLKLTKDK